MPRLEVSSQLEAWLRAYPKKSETKPMQKMAHIWFVTQGWVNKWPMHQRAMLGDFDGIEQLLKNGGDPNQSMTDWFNSTPCGWAASFGRVDSLVSLILAGGDPFDYNLSGNNAMTDAKRENYKNVINFLNQY